MQMSRLYDDIIQKVNETLEKTNADEKTKSEIMRTILETQNTKANVLITGATGCGKSSTINALFNTEKAKVGTSPDPETMEISKYELGPITLWDSPGLGDGKEADERHAAGIRKLLTDKDENGNLLIDIVLVILDGGSRDLGTSYELIKAVIAPCLSNDDRNRLIVGINQADMEMKGRFWDSKNHKPEPELQKFIEEKEKSVKERIKEGTGFDVVPVTYSAGYKDAESGMQEPPYNLSKLLYYIIKNIPAEKRLNIVDQMNTDTSMWSSDDDIENYRQEISDSAQEGIIKKIKGVGAGAAAGAAVGAAIGSVIPVVGTAIGTAVGTIVGGVISFFAGFFD